VRDLRQALRETRIGGYAFDTIGRRQADGQAHRPQSLEQDPRRRRRETLRRLPEPITMDLHRPARRCRTRERLGGQHVLDQARRRQLLESRRDLGSRDLRYLPI